MRIVLEPVERLEAVPEDPSDDRIVECAVAAEADVIVTGDRRFRRVGSFRGIDIVSTADALRRLGPAPR